VKPENRLNQPAAAEPNHGTTLQQVERRSHTRFPVSISAEVTELKTRAGITGRATDLGVGGCYVDTMNPFPEGTQVGVCFHSCEQTFRCRACVTHALIGRGMGLAFTEAAPDQKASLLDWVSELGGEPEAKSRHDAEAEIMFSAGSGPAKQPSAKDDVRELVALLVRKRLLTESETARFRDEPSE